MVLRNVRTGAFEVYDIANNRITAAAPLGSVGLDWLPVGIAADPPTTAAPSMDHSSPSMGSSSQTAQLTQAMAGFAGGSGAAASLNVAAPVADASQQPLLTTPQHA